MPTWSPPLQGKHRFQCSSVAMQQDNSYRILLSTRHCVHAPPGWKEVRPRQLIRPLHLAGWNFQFFKNGLRRFVFLNWRSAIQSSQRYCCWRTRVSLDIQDCKLRNSKLRHDPVLPSSYKSCSSTPGRSFQATQDKVTRDFESVCSRIAYELNGQGDFPSSVFKVMERI